MINVSNLIGGYGVIIGSDGTPSYVSNSGMVRWNGMSQCLEVVDSNNLSTTPLASANGLNTVGLDPTIIDAIGWVHTQIAKEKKLSALCKEHPGLKDLKEKYEVMLALVSENDKG